ncbi:phosphohydrolase [Saccharobesus litoralis]|uniref:Phosphohydrolase n=1 Tax=Saccharobesus litoralis TaxID=2172099 RepID=A0A2S0VS04_9ALTE|nr:HD family phosphohydrolase [Saccharobesus litoralis]AWB67001.1 phosphohydrolase [Saccharobesus litoralis]
MSSLTEAHHENIAEIRLRQIERMIEVGQALSAEKDTTKLLEQILLAAKDITHSDGGTIYSVNEQGELKFETLINDTLGMYMGGTSDKPIPFPAIPLMVDGKPNLSALVAYAANTDQVINIPDAYEPFDGFDMSGARAMDAKIGYRTRSVLTVPMKNHEGELNGVLQLINAQDCDLVGNIGDIIEFDADIERIVVALASQAAVALTNRQLIDDMEELFQSFTKLLAKSIDEKSPYTGGHCRRVPEITMMLAQATHNTKTGPMADFSMTEEDQYALNIAAWLHDCGKIATPEYVMDKATKLETIFDRIELVEARFEVAKRDTQLLYANKIIEQIKAGNFEAEAQLNAECEQKLHDLEEQMDFLAHANIGGEFMTPDDQQKVRDIGESYHLDIRHRKQPLLEEDEITNLSIARGTLNNEERQIINRHINITIDMLEALPFPRHLRNVPEYAGGHHEKMDGTGYPKGLTRDEMSVPARMMAIADIFEALTASDRPYKPAKKLSECLKILGFMKKDNHIDPDLFDIFVDNKIYEQFAKEFLDDTQIDEIDVNKIPGYVPPEQRN